MTSYLDSDLSDRPVTWKWEWNPSTFGSNPACLPKPGVLCLCCCHYNIAGCLNVVVQSLYQIPLCCCAHGTALKIKSKEGGLKITADKIQLWWPRTTKNRKINEERRSWSSLLGVITAGGESVVITSWYWIGSKDLTLIITDALRATSGYDDIDFKNSNTTAASGARVMPLHYSRYFHSNEYITAYELTASPTTCSCINSECLQRMKENNESKV